MSEKYYKFTEMELKMLYAIAYAEGKDNYNDSSRGNINLSSFLKDKQPLPETVEICRGEVGIPSNYSGIVDFHIGDLRFGDGLANKMFPLVGESIILEAKIIKEE